jgi:hypothetical protein
MSQLLTVTDELTEITSTAMGKEPAAPKRTLSALQSIAEDVIERFDAAARHLAEQQSRYDTETVALRETHSSCVEEIKKTAEINTAQRLELEQAWKLEEEALGKQLRAVRQRAREAAFHHHRGSGVKFEAHSEERKSIAERRVVHQECVELEQAIQKVHAEREQEKLAAAKLRCEILAK